MLGCEGDGDVGVGSGGGVVSAYMGDTRGSGVLSSAGDVLEMSVGRGVGGVCDICLGYTWIPAHLRCTQCSIMLHRINICVLTCICLWQILQIQTCLCMVVGPGLVSISPAFMRSIVSHPVGPHGWLA